MANETKPESVQSTPPTPHNGGGADHDRWWATPPTGWAAISEDVFDRWHSQRDAVDVPDDNTALGAMAFGYGAYAVYGADRPWVELEAQLKRDWDASGTDDEGTARADQPWESVREPILVGWTAALPNTASRFDGMVDGREEATDKPLKASSKVSSKTSKGTPKASPPPLPASFTPEVVDHQGDHKVPGGRPDRYSKPAK